jgi:hypothetical protein
VEDFCKHGNPLLSHISTFLLWNGRLYGPIEVPRRFGEIYCLHLQGRKLKEAATRAVLAAFFVYSWTLKMMNHQAARHHIPEDVTVDTHPCENLEINSTLFTA